MADDDMPYEALEPLGGQTARIRCTGTLQGTTIIWEVRLMTLRHYYQTLSKAERRHGIRQFIEVEPLSDGVSSATIGLNLSRIDEPAVLKTIIMLRQWKRLKPGRHRYGETHQFGAPQSS